MDDIKVKFLQKVDKTDSCWLWRGAKHPYSGRGQVSFRGKWQYAPRVSYTLFKGEIPKGMLVCHTCDNPSCVNPSHLWLGDKRSNSHDARKKGRIKGKKGDENPNKRICSEDAYFIRELYKTGDYTLSQLGEHYCISATAIKKIVDGLAW